MTSPGPDGLRIRQTRDATVIRVFPYAPLRPAWGVLASAALVVLWGAARLSLPSGLLWVSVVMLCVGLAGLAAVSFRAVRRASEVLEVYVGKRDLHLVWSRRGDVVNKVELPLVTLEDARIESHGVTLLLEAGAPIFVPMARHSAEARGWMVEHLRGAGLGARRRFGHLGSDSRS